jgi:hypothetical protein
VLSGPPGGRSSETGSAHGRCRIAPFERSLARAIPLVFERSRDLFSISGACASLRSRRLHPLEICERDGLADDLVPDFVGRAREGVFYDRPWLCIGGNQNFRHAGEEPVLHNSASVSDVWLQPHSALMETTLYDGGHLPAEYHGDIFVVFHGSSNRSRRTGYKVVRVLLKNSQRTGEYEDFLTCFVTDDKSVWARPVGVAVAQDGSRLVSEDGNGSIWRGLLRTRHTQLSAPT